MERWLNTSVEPDDIDRMIIEHSRRGETNELIAQVISSKIKPISQQAVNKRIMKLRKNGLLKSLQPTTETATTTTSIENEMNTARNTDSALQDRLVSQLLQPQPGLNGSDLMREGYRGMGHEENSGKVSKGDTASLNTKIEDLPGKNQEDPPITDPETMAAEDLAADAFELFMELVQDPEKKKALESDPELNAKFNQLMNTKIPSVDINRVTEKISRKRRLTMKVPELEAESMKLRNQAAEKKECANCGKKLEGNKLYYCTENCKVEFYVNHPTSIHWNEIRNQALARDNNSCVKCGRHAKEVDHILEIWEGGPEFDLDNLQSLCHECHVAKTNEKRSRRDGNKQE